MSRPPDLSACRAIFWDFDGVIKESVEVKAEAFARLFEAHGAAVQDRVRRHHRAHGGMTRRDKIRHYFTAFVGRPVDEARLDEACDRFGRLTRRAVVDSPWVAGVRECLEALRGVVPSFIVSATPQADLDWIADRLGIGGLFRSVCGAPPAKADILRALLDRTGLPPDGCLMIGDALEDYHAARAAGVGFLLRATDTNRDLFAGIDCTRVKDFGRLP